MQTTSKPGAKPPAQHCDACGKPLGQLPPSAKNKRFCSNSCRNSWHSERRKAAWESYVRSQQQGEKL